MILSQQVVRDVECEGTGFRGAGSTSYLHHKTFVIHRQQVLGAMSDLVQAWGPVHPLSFELQGVAVWRIQKYRDRPVIGIVGI